MTTPTLSKILTRADKGHPVATIADALSVSVGHVYAVLREHRPDRARKARRTTSDIPRMIKGLAKAGLAPSRIAVVLGISRQYVHKTLAS